MKPYELGPLEDKHEAVLADPHPVRLVVAGRDSGYNTLLVEAVKRALAEGQKVLYLTPTDDMLQSEDYYYFGTLGEHTGELLACSMAHIHQHTRPEFKCLPAITDFAADLVVIHEPLLSFWPVDRLLKNLRYIRRLNPAMRLLVAGIPYLQPNTSVKRCFWYRLGRWSAVSPEYVAVWHWPSDDVYINRMKEYWRDSYIINREMRAMWVELWNDDYGKSKPETRPVSVVSRRGRATSARGV